MTGVHPPPTFAARRPAVTPAWPGRPTAARGHLWYECPWVRTWDGVVLRSRRCSRCGKHLFGKSVPAGERCRG